MGNRAALLYQTSFAALPGFGGGANGAISAASPEYELLELRKEETIWPDTSSSVLPMRF